MPYMAMSAQGASWHLDRVQSFLLLFRTAVCHKEMTVTTGCQGLEENDCQGIEDNITH